MCASMRVCGCADGIPREEKGNKGDVEAADDKAASFSRADPEIITRTRITRS